jgi:hypothetical protein
MAKLTKSKNTYTLTVSSPSNLRLVPREGQDANVSTTSPKAQNNQPASQELLLRLISRVKKL